ncbi:MAG: DUF4389 domain-containing protein [Actinomycetota bacterium]
MKPLRTVVLVLGCLLLLPSVALLFGGGALGVGYAIARDDDGYVEVGLDRLQTDTAAIRSEEADFLTDPGSPDWVIDFIDVDIRIAATAVDGDDVFVGIAREADVEDFLTGVAHDVIVEVDSTTPEYERAAGTTTGVSPRDTDIWVASASGLEPTLEWEWDSGSWAAVLMNADGSPGVAADVDVGGKSGAIIPIAISMIAFGVIGVALGVGLIVVATRRTGAHAERPTTAPSAVAGIGEPSATQEHPVALTARLDAELSRWKWLVKWILAIPHFIVLVVLWIAFVVMTFVAGVAILFTGRYPHRIFEFNLGVLRWSWRVNYYAGSGGLGTDRYPPFSLGREPDYPAVLDIAYPEQLSRGLVLVKWWLLAIPHYVILAVLLGGAIGWTDDSDGWRVGLPGGLLGVFVLIAAITLLITDRYPKSLFDLVVGFNRWVYRVVAYAALITDRYPPFRLDQGGDEPSGLPPAPTPTPTPAAMRESESSESETSERETSEHETSESETSERDTALPPPVPPDHSSRSQR